MPPENDDDPVPTFEPYEDDSSPVRFPRSSREEEKRGGLLCKVDKTNIMMKL